HGRTPIDHGARGRESLLSLYPTNGCTNQWRPRLFRLRHARSTISRFCNPMILSPPRDVLSPSGIAREGRCCWNDIVATSAQPREDQTMHRSLICTGLAGLALATFIGSAAVAETVTYKATMNAQSEVPPNESKGAGTAELTYDTTSKTLTWTVTFSDLSGPP